MKTEPYFLEVEDYHLSVTAARRVVIDALLKDGVKSPNGGWDRAEFQFKVNGNPRKVSFRELLLNARKTGTVMHIQSRIDQSDGVFGGDFGIATPTMGIKEVTTTYAGFSKTLKPPMCINPVELEIARDILFYREEACLFSNEYDFVFCTRYHRAYLTSCIALIDAFINRHVLIANFDGYRSDDFELLQRTSRLEDRLELFLRVFAGKDLSSVNGGVEWIHFKRLRQLRNEITHINTPSLGYEIREFTNHFNYVNKGIGGLLSMIRRLQGKQSLGFIESLRTAPLVYFNAITHKGDGNHIIKRVR